MHERWVGWWPIAVLCVILIVLVAIFGTIMSNQSAEISDLQATSNRLSRTLTKLVGPSTNPTSVTNLSSQVKNASSSLQALDAEQSSVQAKLALTCDTPAVTQEIANLSREQAQQLSLGGGATSQYYDDLNGILRAICQVDKSG